MIDWEKFMLRRENTMLRNRLKSCLSLIEDLSNLEAPLMSEETPFDLKKKYVRVVARGKRALDKKK